MRNQYNYRSGLLQILVVALIAGTVAGRNPWACAIALLFLLSWSIADQYFDGSAFQSYIAEIGQLRSDFSKLKTKQDQLDLRGAFGGKSNG